MKHLIAAALLLASAAHAEIVAEATTKVEGGVIRLTDEPSNCPVRSKFMYVRTATGLIHPGCWSVIDGDIFVKFRDGDVMLYAIDTFRWKARQQQQRGQSL